MQMHLFQRRFLFIGLIMLIGGDFARGATYSDPNGFSFTYPAGWMVLNRELMGKLDEGLPAEMKQYIAKNSIDFNKVAVMLVREGSEEFLENLNVVVEQKQIPVNDRMVKQLKETLESGYRQLGMAPDRVDSRIETVASREAIVIDCHARVPGTNVQIQQKQIMLPGGGKTYIITCSANAGSIEKYRPIFDSILASFQAPQPVATGFDWSNNAGLVGGIVGGLIAALWVMLKSARKS
jgi:hypothetical protein